MRRLEVVFGHSLDADKDARHDDYVHVGRNVAVLRFRIRPDDAQWAALNSVGPAPAVAFPVRPVRIHHEGLEPFVADANHAILFDTERPYRRSLIDGEGAEAISFKFPAEVVREAVAQHDPRARDAARVFERGFSRVSSQLFLHQRQLYAHLLRRSAVDPLAVEEHGLTILAGVAHGAYAQRRRPMRRSAAPETEAYRRGLAEGIKELLAGCFSERLTLDDVSDATGGGSPFHLCRVFREHTGAPIHSYLTDLRLRAAVERLADGEPVGRTAARVGFVSHSHFTDVFRRRFEVLPSRLGRALRGGQLAPLRA